jgi:hypothetical protein
MEEAKHLSIPNIKVGPKEDLFHCSSFILIDLVLILC